MCDIWFPVVLRRVSLWATSYPMSVENSPRRKQKCEHAKTKVAQISSVQQAGFFSVFFFFFFFFFFPFIFLLSGSNPLLQISEEEKKRRHFSYYVGSYPKIFGEKTESVYSR